MALGQGSSPVQGPRGVREMPGRPTVPPRRCSAGGESVCPGRRVPTELHSNGRRGLSTGASPCDPVKGRRLQRKAGRESSVRVKVMGYARILGSEEWTVYIDGPQATGHTRFQEVRVGRLSRCPHALLLLLGVPPAPPARLHIQSFPFCIGNANCIGVSAFRVLWALLWTSLQRIHYKTGRPESSDTFACWCLSVLRTAIPEFN